MPKGNGWVWNQALIEFGALQCTQRRPACVICPLQAALRRVSGDPDRHRRAAGGCSTQERGGIPRLEPAVPGTRRRGAPPHSQRSTLAELGPLVKSGFADEDLPWLYGVVTGLARDGLVTIQEPAAQYDAGQPGS